MSEQFTLFWNGPFSQWASSNFTLDGVEYNCAEQYMMAAKAKMFEDDNALENIMESDDPPIQKKWGRLVEDFDGDVWEEDEDNGRPRCWNIVWRGNMAKFSQNTYLLSRLFETEGTTCVEASPYDPIWGIGLRSNDPAARNRESWQGKNWLGEVITSVRSFLKADPSPYTSSDDPRKPV